MTAAQETMFATLLEIAGKKPVVWISASASAEADWTAKTGWLRFQHLSRDKHPNLIARKFLPAATEDIVLAGEWVDGVASFKTWRTGTDLQTSILRECGANTEDALPAIRIDIEMLKRDVPGDAGTNILIACYYGFKSAHDAAQGKLSCIAERFLGFGQKSKT
jgi:hypothetical protein